MVSSADNNNLGTSRRLNGLGDKDMVVAFCVVTGAVNAGLFLTVRSKKRLDYSKTPHVCFKIELKSRANGREELTQLLESRFRSHFNSVRRIKTWFLARYAVELEVGQKSFLVALAESKLERDEWIIQVSPTNTPVVQSPELTMICHEIHTLLAATANISATRWYFEGFHSQSGAVATPEELPWNQT